MKIVFLPRARADLGWFRRYYEEIFPDGAVRARLQFGRTMQTLREHPLAGRQGEEGTREIVLGRTPFIFVYVVREDRIEIIRVFDQRAERSGEWP
ncbi:type II toxin-antitoxin system RelE/ParE family toxin [Jiella sonneratiae]|uniref:Type II toxin-antitoxin system RelE/ParE family toxin n=1 Tax=Jiella sonneratiae TaxID=2816856 RepID=A0ABS3J2M8_9HYPH|nr:type II toxin-antitoxin system RelE/ParE family toxin [Jiella sonneratiae]MBO0903924.1 type II toxin-antitoxin system RelE/ParE family toxin [Jiella sonneratiae]